MKKKNDQERLTRFNRPLFSDEEMDFEPIKIKDKSADILDDIEIIDEDLDISLKRKPMIKLARHKKKKKKLKKWAAILLLILVIIASFFGTKSYIDRKEKEKKEEEIKQIEEIKSHYNSFVKTNKQTDLFVKENDEYKKKGIVYANVNLSLDKIEEITLNTKYFPIKDSKYYVLYNDVIKIDEIKNNDRYKNYLPFNLNVVTKDEFSLYQDDNKMYTFYESMSFPIIINNYEDKYYVEYQDMLLNIYKEDVKEVVESSNTTKNNQSKITTLAYHRVYDTYEKCLDPYICIKKSSFDQEMKYLKDNNYFTLSMDELYMYLKGNLQIEKGVVLTFDDGYIIKSGIEVLEKYDLLGTIFVVSGDFQDFSVFSSPNLFLQSHTHNMYRNNVCQGGNQGGAILCASEKAIKEDLEKSLETLNVKPIALAFPFYDYNDKAIKVLKEVGFKMSFIGREGVMGRATPNKTNVYKIPRMTVWEQSKMSFNKWKSYL